jgi:hypothetical protein
MASLLMIDDLEADKRYVEHQLSLPDNDPWGTIRLMWKSRLAEIDRQINDLGARRTNYASVALVFNGNPVVGSSDIRVDFTADALTSFQKLIFARLAERERYAVGDSTALPKRGRLPGARNTNLYIRDLVRGSMGFVLEELSEQEELLPTKLKGAVESVTELLDRLNRAPDEDFTSIVAEAEPRVVQAIQKFARVLYDSGASARIAGDEYRTTLSVADVDRLSKLLNQIEVTEATEEQNGELQGLLPDKLEFEFRVAGTEEPTLSGDVTEELAMRYTQDPDFVEQFLHKPSRAKFRIVRTNRYGGSAKEQRIMEALEPISTT